MILLNRKKYSTNWLFQVIGITFLFFLSISSSAQVDSIVKSDTSKSAVIIHNPKVRHSPKKAALFSTVLPGLGQAYNKKYWKIPVIYAGFASLGYFIVSNQTKYVQYRDAYKFRIDKDPLTVDDYEGKYTEENLNTLQRYYHRYRDLSVIGAGLLYIINIVDASVDAHLFTFNVDDDLSFIIRPTWINTASVNHYTSGVSLSIKFNFVSEKELIENGYQLIVFRFATL